MKKSCIRDILMIILVINFIALVLSLTNFIQNNPLKEYRLILVLSFIIIAYFAQKKCPQATKNEPEEME